MTSTLLPRRACYLLFSLLCLAIAAHAFGYLYQGVNVRNPFHLSFAAAGWAVPAHFFAAGMALILAPLQYSSSLRRRLPRMHRTGGWLYVMAVLTGGISGLLLAPRAQGGLPTAVAFVLLALVWLACTGRALQLAILGDHVGHRRWMLRSIALTFAAVSLRIYLGIGIGLLGLPFLTAYTAAAWLCWTVNLALCELLLRGPLRSVADTGLASRPAAV